MTSRTKLLYVAGDFRGSTTRDRKRGLEEAGLDLVELDSSPWIYKPNRIWRGIHHRVHTGPLIWGLNRAILETAAREKPQVVWIDRGVWVMPNTIEILQSKGAKVVHYTPDPAISFHATPSFLKSIPRFDLIFTTKKWEMDLYRQHGARNLVHSPKSACPSRTRPLQPSPDERKTYETDLVFIGHAEAHYVETIRRILALLPGLSLKIWGAWGKAVKAHPELAPYWQGRGAFGDEYAKALTSAKIGLGLLTKLVPETETARTFEIPACGTLLLAERTDSHLSLFQEGEEAEYFDSPEEAAEKIRLYLTDENRRERVALAGYRRFIESDYTTARYMRDCARKIEDLIYVKHEGQDIITTENTEYTETRQR
jgi:spore maturation protein CgeB